MWAETKIRYGKQIIQAVLAVAVVSGGVAYLILGNSGHWVLVGCLFGATMTAAWVYEHWRLGLWRSVCDTNFASCLKCAYDLRDHGAHGTCPECGEPFVLKDTKDRWMNTRSDEGPDGDDTPDVSW